MGLLGQIQQDKGIYLVKESSKNKSKRMKVMFVTPYFWTSPPPPCSKLPQPCSYMPQRFTFKKGDIIEGDVINNTLQSEPPQIFIYGGMRIGFGGRDSQTIMLHSKEGRAIPIGKYNPPTESESQPLAREDKKNYKPYIIGGIAVVVLIGGYITYRTLKN